MSSLAWLLLISSAWHIVAGNNSDLKCSTCRVVVNEILYSVENEDLNKTLDGGSFRIDPKGNMMSKKVPFTRSDTQLTDLLDTVCALKLHKYGKMVDENNRHGFVMTESHDHKPFDLKNVQTGEEISNWLRMSCESLIDDHDEDMKQIFMKNETNPERRICMDLTKYCSEDQLKLVFKAPELKQESSDTETEKSTDTPEEESSNTEAKSTDIPAKGASDAKTDKSMDTPVNVPPDTKTEKSTDIPVPSLAESTTSKDEL